MVYKFLFQLVNRFHEFSPFICLEIEAIKIQRQGYCPAAFVVSIGTGPTIFPVWGKSYAMQLSAATA